MRKKFQVGIFFLIISTIFLSLSFNPQLTGATIGTFGKFSYLQIIGIAFFIISALIFVSRQTLDAIMIPTGNYKMDRERTDKAYQEGKDKPGQIYLISGRIDEPKKTSQVYEIYRRLRDYGIKLGNIKIEGKSKNTLENVLFSLEKLKKMRAHDIGIASYPSHLDRFEDLIEAAKKEGLIDKDFRIHRLETGTSFRDWLYGILHRAIYRYELAHGGLEAVEKSRLNHIKQKLTKLIDYLIPEKKK